MTPGSSRTASDQIFAQLMREILSGILRPRDQLSERALVERFGASRTPVREAVKRLLERGLLTAGRRGVAVVRDIDQREVEELYAVRLKLEAWAARRTAALIRPEEITALEEINRRFEKAAAVRDLPRMLDIKAEFHSTAARATRNRFLAEALIALREKAYAVRYASWQDPDRARETVEVHEEMIRALRARDGARDRTLVLDHVSGPLGEYRQRLSAPAPARTHLIGVRRRRARRRRS